VVKELVLSDRYDLLVFDELNCAIAEGYVDVNDVIALLDAKPRRLSVIITGRAAPPELIDVADTVTDMRCVKHAFSHGAPARKGIEY
jgi:cob(I)alamin adenosyltransferase